MKKKFLMLASVLMLLILNSSLTVDASPNVKFNKFTGTVTSNDKKPYPFVYVYLKEHPQIKTATELNGTFTLFVPDTIKFPFTVEFYTVGVKIRSHTVTSKNRNKRINIVLEVEKPKEVAVDTSNSRGEDLGGFARGDGSTEFINAKIEARSLRMTDKIPADGAEKSSVEFASMDIVDRAAAGGAETSVGRIMDADLRSVVGTPLMVPPPSDFGGMPNFQPDAAAGLLTAGELNDFTKWTLWADIAKNILAEHQKTWRILPDERYTAQLTNPDGMPIVDALVFLRDRQGNTIWQARTDNTGRAELWARMIDDGIFNAGKPYSLLYSYQGKTIETKAFPFSERINTAELKVKCSEARNVDIHFIVDATGSMGDEIRYLQVELYDVIEKFKERNPHLQLRTGSVFYRDIGDEYVTRKLPLDSDINKTIEFIKQQSAAGGGDYPEALDSALIDAIELENWSENALARIAFIVLDAPPHSDPKSVERMHRQIRLAAMKGIRLVPLVCSGADKSTEYLMRSIALATNGTYVFLTDESGIGDPHLKPTTDKYEVEKLNHILLRIITEYSTIPNCNNNWEFFDKEISSQEKFIPKPYKENPENETERLETAQVMKIYPNPCSGNLNVDILLPISELYITDGTGKALQYFSFDSPKSFAVDLNGYSNGIYFINAFYQGRWYSLKFLLVK